MLETCRGVLNPYSWLIEKNTDQVLPLQLWRPKWNKLFTDQFPQILSSLTREPALHDGNLQGEALGLLVCALKRIKSLMKISLHSPGLQNELNFFATHFIHI